MTDIKLIDDYNTRNLNKAAWLLSVGASFDHVSLDAKNYVTFWLNGVDPRNSKLYWEEDLTVAFWEFWKLRTFLKEQYNLALTKINGQKP